MQCESCGAKEANVHLTHVVDNVARKINLCEECAAKHGISLQGPMSLTDILLGLGTLEEEPRAPAKKCAFCRMRLSDFKKTSRLGCPVCYDTFGPELNPMVADMQKGSRHVGKVPCTPAGDGARNPRIAALQRELETAIAAENYEEAAKLRDEICIEKAQREKDEKALQGEAGS